YALSDKINDYVSRKLIDMEEIILIHQSIEVRAENLINRKRSFWVMLFAGRKIDKIVTELREIEWRILDTANPNTAYSKGDEEPDFPPRYDGTPYHTPREVKQESSETTPPTIDDESDSAPPLTTFPLDTPKRTPRTRTPLVTLRSPFKPSSIPAPPTPPAGIVAMKKILSKEPDPPPFNRTLFKSVHQDEIAQQIETAGRYLEGLKQAFKPIDDQLKKHARVTEELKTPKEQLPLAEARYEEQKRIQKALVDGNKEHEVVTLESESGIVYPIYPDDQVESVNSQLRAMGRAERRENNLPDSLGPGHRNSVVLKTAQRNIKLLKDEIDRLQAQVMSLKTQIDRIENKPAEGKRSIKELENLHERVKVRIDDWERAIKNRVTYLKNVRQGTPVPKTTKKSQAEDAFQLFKDNVPSAEALRELYRPRGTATAAFLGPLKKENSDEFVLRLKVRA
nr:hypothetical protein [Chlamydiota bacterium]